MRLEKFLEKPIHFKIWFLFETIRNSSKQKKKKKIMIALIESMEELIHQKKFTWTIKYVVDKIQERITWNINTV